MVKVIFSLFAPKISYLHPTIRKQILTTGGISEQKQNIPNLFKMAEKEDNPKLSAESSEKASNLCRYKHGNYIK